MRAALSRLCRRGRRELQECVHQGRRLLLVRGLHKGLQGQLSPPLPKACNVSSPPYARARLPCRYAGCTDASKANFNARATFDDGTCAVAARQLSPAGRDPISAGGDRISSVARRQLSAGCRDPAASNYDASATPHEGSMCEYKVLGCPNSTADMHAPSASHLCLSRP